MKKHFLASLLTVLLVLPVISLAQTDEDIDPITTANTCTNLTYDLRITSRDSQTGGQVSDLQFFLQTKGYLNTEPTGYFGLLTVTAVKQFQTANSISPLGYVGPLTRTKINSISCNNISSGTASSTTPTNTTTSSIEGCTPGALFSSATGAPCSTIATTVVTPTIQSTFSQVSSSYQGYIFNNNLTLNDKGTDVLMLQSFLEAKGFFAKSSYLKGTFDVNTKNALAKYQTSVGISPADGSFGPITRAQINSMINNSPTTTPSSTLFVNITSHTNGQSIKLEDLTTPYAGTFLSQDFYATIKGGSGKYNTKWIFQRVGSYGADSGEDYGFANITTAKKTYIFNYAGTWNVTLEVIDSDGNRSSSTIQLTVLDSHPFVTPTISLIYPGKGDFLSIGKTYTIKWISTGIPTGDKIFLKNDPTTFANSNIMIDLINQRGFTIKSIAPTVPNNGNTDWTIPSDIKDGKYKIQITCQTCGRMNNGEGVFDLSDDYFTISSNSSTTNTTKYKSGPFVILRSQKSDETWKSGNQYQIKWDHIYSELSGKLHAILVSDSAYVSDITYCDLGYVDITKGILSVNLSSNTKCNKSGQTPGTLILGKYRVQLYDEQIIPTVKGGYEIAISKGLVTIISGTTQDQLKLNATQATDGSIHVNANYGPKSYDPFTAYLKANCPAGVTVSQGSDVCNTSIKMPEIVGPGSYQSVFTFSNTSGTSQTVTFQVSLEEPSNKIAATASIVIGSTVSSIPQAVTTCTNNAVGTTVATTTANPLSINILSPNGGEVAVIGQTCRITWSSTPNIDKVYVGYSYGPGSLNWFYGNGANNISNVGYYDWNVGVGNTTNDKIKIHIIGYQTGVGSASDYSDDYFSVSK